MRIPDATRARVLRALRDAIWCDAGDDEIATACRTSIAAVRAVRAELRRDLDLAAVVQRVDDLRARTGYPGTTAELLRQIVDSAYHRAELRGWDHTDERMRALRAALRTDRELRALERMADDAA